MPICIMYTSSSLYSSIIWKRLRFYYFMKYIVVFIHLTLIWVGFLGVGWGVGGKITPLCLKLVRIMLETSNLARK